MCEKCGVDHPTAEELTFNQVLMIVGDIYSEMSGGVQLLSDKAKTSIEQELIATLQSSLTTIMEKVNSFIDDFEKKEQQLKMDIEAV